MTPLLRGTHASPASPPLRARFDCAFMPAVYKIEDYGYLVGGNQQDGRVSASAQTSFPLSRE